MQPWQRPVVNRNGRRSRPPRHERRKRRGSTGSTSWTGIGALDPGTDQEYLEVLDMGDSWELRFSYAGEVEVTMAISRRQLDAADWTVAVPSSFASEAEVAEAAGRLPVRTATG